MTFLNTSRVKYADSGAIDAFNRLRIAESYTLFDGKQLYSKDTTKVVWDEVNSGGSETSVHSTTDAAVTMTVSSNNQYVIRQTKMRFNYQPGKSILCFFTGVMATEANVTKRIGYFSSGTVAPYTPTNGYYFQNNGTTAQVVINKNGTPNAVSQASWNIDTMDGNGPSKITINWAMAQIFVIDFEWLGVGRVRFGLVVNGIIYYVHEFLHANIANSVYTSSPNQPVRYEIRSTGGSGTLVHICSSIQSEGGFEPQGFVHGVSNGSTSVAVGTTAEVLLALRCKSTHTDLVWFINQIGAINESNDRARLFVSINPTFSGTALNYNSFAPHSGIEFAVSSGDNTITDDGIVLGVTYFSQSQVANVPLKAAIRAGVKIDGTRDIVALCAQKLTVGTSNTLGFINWQETP